jgi:hypothetical protein
MTLERMLQLLLDSEKEWGDVWIDGESCKAIAEALRAGQELSTLVLQGASIGARGERDLFATACKFKSATTKGGEK